MGSMKRGDDPKEFKVDEVNDFLDSTNDTDEVNRVLAAEAAEGARKTILQAHGWDPDVRTDGSGRRLYPWEVDPKVAAQAGRANIREAGPAGPQSPSSDAVPTEGTPQPASTPAGSGTPEITVDGTL